MNTGSFKSQAAARAIEFIRPGMKLGLGTGSTAAKFAHLLAGKVRAGLDVACAPTSEATRQLAQSLGLRLITLDEEPELDLTIDGADEIDAQLRLIKGGGGALLREKIVAMASGRLIIIADHTKMVQRLGRFALPVEVVRFGLKATLKMIESAAKDVGCSGVIALRQDEFGEPFITDGDNLIADCAFSQIADPEALADVLEMIPGVIEHGLFLGIADAAIIAGPGGVTILEAPIIND